MFQSYSQSAGFVIQPVSLLPFLHYLFSNQSFASGNYEPQRMPSGIVARSRAGECGTTVIGLLNHPATVMTRDGKCGAPALHRCRPAASLPGEFWSAVAVSRSG